MHAHCTPQEDHLGGEGPQNKHFYQATFETQRILDCFYELSFLWPVRKNCIEYYACIKGQTLPMSRSIFPPTFNEV
jgi:hypothetical protein